MTFDPNNVVEIALQISFDAHPIRSCLDLESLEQKFKDLLEESGVKMLTFEFDRFMDMEPDTGLSMIWVRWKGTTLRPYREERYKTLVAEHLNTVQEVQDKGWSLTADDISIRVLFYKHAG